MLVAEAGQPLEEGMMPTNYRNTIRAVTIVITILGAGCAVSASVRAETIYRSTSPNGEVTYSSQPVPGARTSKAIDIESLSPEQRRAGLLLRRQDKALSAQVNAQLRSREAQWRRVDREIVSAQKVLVAAERALRKGRTPLPGEWRGNVGGGSRLTEAYFQRLRQLDTRVEQAKARLDRAYSARNALK